MLEGLQMESTLRPLSICHESDSLFLIQILGGTTKCLVSIWYLVEAIKKIMMLVELHVIHIYRDGNNVADSLADWSALERCSHVFHIIGELPKKGFTIGTSWHAKYKSKVNRSIFVLQRKNLYSSRFSYYWFSQTNVSTVFLCHK